MHRRAGRRCTSPTTRACCLALSPHYAVEFLLHHGLVGFLVLGSVFLTVTGAEALYADMGHFGRWPIQAAWLFFALPCLALNYLGQGAFALKALACARAHGAAARRPGLVLPDDPADAARCRMVILATVATVIASQAVITGAFSLTQQAIQLGLLPRMDVQPHLRDPGRPDLPAADQHHADDRACWSWWSCSRPPTTWPTPTAWR